MFLRRRPKFVVPRAQYLSLSQGIQSCGWLLRVINFIKPLRRITGNDPNILHLQRDTPRSVSTLFYKLRNGRGWGHKRGQINQTTWPRQSRFKSQPPFGTHLSLITKRLATGLGLWSLIVFSPAPSRGGHTNCSKSFPPAPLPWSWSGGTDSADRNNTGEWQWWLTGGFFVVVSIINWKPWQRETTGVPEFDIRTTNSADE